MGSAQGDRIKLLRNHYNLSQKRFGERLGVTDAAISRIEKSERALTDQMAKAICREFNADYFWLTEGIGDMLTDFPGTLLEMLVEEYRLNEVQKKMIKTFLELDDDQKELLTSILEKMFK